MSFQELIGEKIISVHSQESHESIGFLTASGRALKYEAYGDCCSYSWFEHISGLQHLIGGTVTEIRERDMPDSTDKDPEHEWLSFYGWAIVTDKGYFDIEMRNSSNGYYGGSVDDPESFGIMELPQIKEDF